LFIKGSMSWLPLPVKGAPPEFALELRRLLERPGGRCLRLPHQNIEHVARHRVGVEDETAKLTELESAWWSARVSSLESRIEREALPDRHAEAGCVRVPRVDE